MEEFLKQKAEELDYLINEREQLDSKKRKTPKEKEDLEAISSLIKELSEQLQNSEVKNTSEELSFYNEERDLLDNKIKKTKKDKKEIQSINELLKELSNRLKEMSSRKDLEEYEAEAEASQTKLDDFSKQLKALEALEKTLEPSVYQSAIERINQLQEQEKQNLSYNERIISTYYSLKENNYKLNILHRIKELEIENQRLTNIMIPQELLTNNNIDKYEEQKSFDITEIEKLTKELNYLTKLQKEKVARYDKLEVSRIQKEIEIIETHLNNAKKDLKFTTDIIDAYYKKISNDHEKNILSLNLSVNDSEENISILIENCQRILPENLQEKAKKESELLENVELIQDKELIKEDYLDEEATEEELTEYYESLMSYKNGRKLSEYEKKEKEELSNSSSIIEFNSEVNENKPGQITEEEVIVIPEEKNHSSSTISFENSTDAMQKIRNILNNRKSSPEDNQSKQNETSDKVNNINLENVSREITNSSSNSASSVNSSNSESISEQAETTSSNSHTEDIPRLNSESYGVTEYEPDFEDLDDDLDFENNEKKSLINGVVTNIRKMKKKTIVKLSVIAASLILLATVGKGAYQKFSSQSNKKNSIKQTEMTSDSEPEAAIEILSQSGIPYDQIEQEMGNISEMDSPIEIQEITEVESKVKNQDKMENQSKYIPYEYDFNNDYIHEESNVTNHSEVDMLNNEIIIDLPNEGEVIYHNITPENLEENSLDFSEQPIEILSEDEFYSDINPTVMTEQPNTTEQNILETAFLNSDLIENMAWDEYSTAASAWEGIKEKNIPYWTDKPLAFEKDEATGTYLVKQQDSYGIWVGMGYTDEATVLQYYNNLNELNSENTKGARK